MRDRFLFVERCALAHERQVIEIDVPDGPAGLFSAPCENGGRAFIQRSARHPSRGFLLIEADPFETVSIDLAALRPCDRGVDSAVTCVRVDGAAAIGNGHLSVEAPYGEAKAAPGAGGLADVSGPVRRLRCGGGPWRGQSFLDVRAPVRSWRGKIVEEGPLRCVADYRVLLGDGGRYEATITVDAGQRFVRIDETFDAGVADQLVWDFTGADLPRDMYLLDSSASHTARRLHYHFDQRQARLAAWTQGSQLLDLSDGYAWGFPEGNDAAGVVALEGGKWRGARLNHLEAWTRRWVGADPVSRRGVPWDAKADSSPGSERIPARGTGRTEPHFSLEGWIGHGRRAFALVICLKNELNPAGGAGEPLGGYEDKPRREDYRRQQGLMRRIHVQRGLMPLQDVATMPFDWPGEPAISAVDYGHRVVRRHFDRWQKGSEEERLRQFKDYLETRVHGFWEGSGAAYTNPVSGRGIAPQLLHFERLARDGRLTPEQIRLYRAQFVFLAHLYASENYYPGPSTMLPAEDPESVEPTLAGMANQNFYTDCINVFGMAAQVFPNHPCAPVWRKRFSDQWHQQLLYHMYPESGVWEESHTYFHHVLTTVLPTLLRRRADGVDDEFANPAFQKLCGAALRQLTPPDDCHEGSRHLVAFGDHGVDLETYRELYADLAEAFTEANPELARQFAWAYREMKGDRCGVAGLTPPWKDEYVEGLGFMFRAESPDGRQSLLALRSGAAWAHHHNDDGSLQFFARGRTLITDAAFGLPAGDRSLKFSDRGHSRWTLRDRDSLNCFWRFNRGWLCARSSDGPLPYAVAYSPVFMAKGTGRTPGMLEPPVDHWRSVLRIGPTLYLVADCAETMAAQVVRFHVAGHTVQTVRGGIVAQPAPDVRLTIAGLTPAGGRVLLRADKPAPAKGEARSESPYATTEVAWDIGATALALWVIAAGGERDEVMIEGTDPSWRVRFGGESFTAQVGADFKLEVRDSTSGAIRRIALRGSTERS